jgi:uncharacterized protein YkwD
MISNSRLALVGRTTPVCLALLICGLIANAQQPSEKTSAPAFLSSPEAEVINEINLARANPSRYATYLEETRKYYNGKSYLPPSRNKPVITFDGVAAVDEAIKFLRASNPLGPLQPSLGLSFGAKDHVKDMTLTGISGHKGSDGSTPNDRVSRYGDWKSTIGEAIVYRVSTAREMVLELIVDDGTPDRGHRKNIFEPGYQVAGVAISAPSSFGTFCVIDYAGGFTDKAGLKASEASSISAVSSTTPANKPAPKTPASGRTSKTKSVKRG